MLFNKEGKDKKRLNQAMRLNLAYQKTFADGDGREVLKDLMKSTGYDSTTFVPNSPYDSAFNEGARSVVIRIIKQLNMNPESFLKLMEDIDEDAMEVLDV